MVASSLGAKGSPPQSVAAYGALTVVLAPWAPSRSAVTCCSAQLDALRMKPGRSSVSVSERMATGTPPMICGIGRVLTVRPPSGRRTIAARIATVPRSTGPTLPGRAIARPARPPSVGPVSDTVPLSGTGAPPVPASALTVPTLLFAGQVPASALASGQTGTPLRLPARPGGRFAVTRVRFSSASLRETVIATAPAGRPAAVEVALTLRAGANASGRPWSIVKVAVACLGAVPLHGVSVAVSGLVPQVGGLARTACGPPLKVSANF